MAGTGLLNSVPKEVGERGRVREVLVIEIIIYLEMCDGRGEGCF